MAEQRYTYYTMQGSVVGYDDQGWNGPYPGSARLNYEKQSSTSLKVNADGLGVANDNPIRALFSGATHTGSGSAIRFKCHKSVGPSLFVHDTDFLNNIVNDVNGTGGTGTICAENANRAEIMNCTFTGNYASLKGSAISLCNSEVKDALNVSLIEDCTFTNNTGGGSAVFVSDATTVTNCVFKGNMATVLKATDKVGAIHCDTPLSSKSDKRGYRQSTLLVQGSRFETDTDGIYVTKTDATFKGHNYMAGNIIGENTIWVDKHGTNHSIGYSIKIENDTTSPETIANPKLEFAGKIISADISGGTGSTIQFKNSGNYTYADGSPEVPYSHEVQVNGTFTGVENLVFSGDEPIRFDGGSFNESNQLVGGNVKTAKTLTIDAGKLGTTGWDPYTVATGIVFDPIGFDFGTGTYEPTNVGEFLKLDIVVDGTTVAQGGQLGQSVLLSVVDDGDANDPDYTYRFNHTGEDEVTRTYGLLYHDTHLILTELKTQDLFVNSWYEEIYTKRINKLNEKHIYGENLFPNVDMIGVHEFAYLTIDDHTFTPNEGDGFGKTRYKSINKAYANLAGTNVYVTGGTFSGDQYGYGANLVVCNDQRNGFEVVMGVDNTVSAVHSNPMRKVDLETVNESAGAETNGKSMFTDGVNDYYLFGGANLTVSSAGQALGTASRSVSIYAGLEGKGVFAGDRITVNATGGSMTLQNTKLVVKESKAGYAASTVTTSPDCQVQLLMGGSYILGGSTAGEAYAMTLDQGSTITIDKTAADLAVSLYACAGSLVGNGNNELAMTLTGAPELKISSGTYNYLVAGGHLLQGNASRLIFNGDTSLTIDGGNFHGNIYGGNISRFLKDATSDRLLMTGDTNILIKVGGTQSVIISEPTGTTPGYYGNIFGGSNGRGKVVGNTNIVFQGDAKEADDGSRLTFTGAISGDSSGAGYFHQDGVFGHYGFVTGDRNLTFQDFDGDFKTSKIVNIDTITFTGNTDMKFTNSDLNLTDIGTWKFNYSDAGLPTLDCSAMTNGLNVAGDKLVVGGDGWESWVFGTSTSSWMLIDAKDDGNGLDGNFNSVTLFGATASKSGVDKWEAEVSYNGNTKKLSLDFNRTNGSLALSKA